MILCHDFVWTALGWSVLHVNTLKGVSAALSSLFNSLGLSLARFNTLRMDSVLTHPARLHCHTEGTYRPLVLMAFPSR